MAGKAKTKGKGKFGAKANVSTVVKKRATTISSSYSSKTINMTRNEKQRLQKDKKTQARKRNQDIKLLNAQIKHG